MVKARWDSSNLVVLEDSSGLACVNCCGAVPGVCCPGFTEDETPSVYNVTISGVEDCPAPGDATVVNGTWELSLIECQSLPWPEEPGCQWEYKEAEVNGNVWIAFVRTRYFSCTVVYVSALYWEGVDWRSALSSADGYTHSTGFCDTVNNRWLTCVGSRRGINGSATFSPAVGSCPANVSCG